jgi:4-amino-4-deoxy-L-arabinose transferase-like glycosyltransferase
VRRLLVWIAAPLCVLGALVVAWLFELSTTRVLLLAPVIVFGTAAVVGLALLWARMAWESVRGHRDAR